MPQLPMIPGWDGVHPMIIHFPIVLLLLPPLFLLIGAFLRPDRRDVLLYIALILMVLATASMFIAFETGEAAGALAKRTAEIKPIIENHRDLADYCRSSFTMATVLFGLLVLMRERFHFRTRDLSAVLPLGFVVFYGLGLFWLFNTAYMGERLVHEFGVKGAVAP